MLFKKNKRLLLVITLIIVLLIILFVFQELYNPINRHFLTKKYYKLAKKLAKEKGKQLIVIGDPCCGNVVSSVQKKYPNCGHGDITIDLYGCDKCYKMDINDIHKWAEFDSNKYVIIETATLSFSKDINAVMKQIKRISGGDFYSSGGTNTILWKFIGHKLYSLRYPEALTIMTYPVTPGDKTYKVYDLKQRKMIHYSF